MSDHGEVQILTTRTCRWTLRLSVAFREKGIPFRLVNVIENGRKAPWFQALTPFGRTPVLRHGGHTLPESLVISEYIDEGFPGRRLFPETPLQRAWARVWMQYCDGTLINALSAIARTGNAEDRAKAIGALIDKGAPLEEFVAVRNLARTYWQCDKLLLPDLCYYTFFEALERTGSEASIAFFAACRNLARWRDSLFETVVFREAARELDSLAD
jgi:glutathione S-transferase